MIEAVIVYFFFESTLQGESKMRETSDKKIRFHGLTGHLVQNITDHFLIGMKECNPGILSLLKNRDVKPHMKITTYASEYAGKYISSCAYAYMMTGDEDLKKYAESFISDMLSYQDDDGYLGCFVKEVRFTGRKFSPDDEEIKSADVWGHYHIMIGLTEWYDITGNAKYFEAVEKIAGLISRYFYDGKPAIASMGNIEMTEEMNLSIIHIYCILYNRTGKKEYLDFADKVLEEIENDENERFLSNALSGLDFYKFPRPRWESLHIIMGFIEMYKAKKEMRYLDAAKNIFFSILKTDIHNTGAFSTGEQATGNTYSKGGSIETCCVVAFNMLAIDLYSVTKDVRIAEYLDLSHFNAVLGSHNLYGYWATYSTPMEGVKTASHTSIVFQATSAMPNVNCCSVNAARGPASYYKWAVFGEGDDIYVNSFESSDTLFEDGSSVKVSGLYPYDGRIKIEIESVSKKNLFIRIPSWSVNTSLKLDGVEQNLESGSYFEFGSKGKRCVELVLDMSVYAIKGEKNFEGHYSIYAGPVLFGFNACDNPSLSADDIFDLDEDPQRTLLKDDALVLKFKSGLILKDFFHLGQEGSWYTTWLKINTENR